MVSAYPLQYPDGWKRTKNPKTSRFGDFRNKPSISNATYKINEELRLLGAKNVVISSNLKLRNDGLPYSNQRKLDDNGIAVYFTIDNEQMVIACDSYLLAGCNMWAIGKTIEAMRGIDRWGCSEILNRAFNGFKALPESETQTNTAWWEILEINQDSSLEEIKNAYRRMSKKYHPDVNKNNPEYFHVIQEAYHQAQQ